MWLLLNKKILYCLGLALLALLFLTFCSSAIVVWHASYHWHDQQRIYQLLLLVCASPLAIFLLRQTLPQQALVLLLGVFAVGSVSSLSAAWPDWAFKEWARYVALALATVLTAGLAVRPLVYRFVLWAMACVGAVHAYQFLLCYLIALVSGVRLIDPDDLLGGFSNPRFFGQFQAMLLPILAVLIVQCWQARRHMVVLVLFLVLAIQWSISYCLGGRGLWLGLFLSHISLVLVNRHLWRIVAPQLIAGVFGFLIFLLLFNFIPSWLELELNMRDGLRTGLSGRELIWRAAWDMALANPWLGVGPMHFSATYNLVAAHPHQVILQWLAEWGFVATGMVIALAVWGGVHAVASLRRATASELDAGLWTAIVGALILAQVDGVFVMPYTETWLVLLIGLGLARWSAPKLVTPVQRMTCVIVAVPAVLILVHVLIKEVPGLPSGKGTYLPQSLTVVKPRFWTYGWIPRQEGVLKAQIDAVNAEKQN